MNSFTSYFVFLLIFISCSKECDLKKTADCATNKLFFEGNWESLRIQNKFKNTALLTEEKEIGTLSFVGDDGFISYYFNSFAWNFSCDSNSIQLIIKGNIKDSVKNFKVDILENNYMKF